MNAYNEKANEAYVKSQMNLVGRLLKEGKKDEARLVLEFIKTWLEVAYFAKRKIV